MHIKDKHIMADRKKRIQQQMHPDPPAAPVTALRQRAEEMAARGPDDVAALSPEQMRRTLHELRVHQIELEMQNEELRTDQVALDAARARYFDLYDMAPVGYLTLGESGLILEANLTAATLLGTARSALVKQSLARFIVPDDMDIYARHRQQLGATDAAQMFELRMVNQAGTQFWVRLDATAAQDAAGVPVCRMVLSAIADRKRAEAALRQNEERFRHVAEIAADVAYSCRTQADGRFALEWITGATERITGYTSAELMAHGCWRFLVSAEDGALFDEKLIGLAAGSQGACDLRIRHKNGSIVWLASFAQCVADPHLAHQRVLYGSLADITERKRVEDELAKSAARFRSYFDLPLHGIAITSPAKGWLQVNPQICSMLGYARDEITRLTWSEMTHSDDLAADVAQFDQMLAGQIEQYQMEKRFIRKDGTVIWTNLAVGCVRSADGRVDYVVALLHDISARKQAQADKEKLEAQNRQLQKSESLGRMAGAIAHHFNNQLMVVMGNLELTMEDLLPRGADPLVSLNAAMQACNRAAEASVLMLTYLGQTPAAHVALDLSGICRQSLPVLGAGMPICEALEIDVPLPGPAINANANQIQQVLTNLLTNAWEANEAGGVLRLAVTTVAAADIPANNRFPIGCQPQDRAYACLAVADTGGGIASQDIEKLFDPFFTTKFTGRGLGLPVVLGIVRAHEGFITVESELGHGSIFRVFLP
ncbi:MAG: PAS domain S-box protein, partial [bacterium]|nr:PAS domain S-box protein [bacterium]